MKILFVVHVDYYFCMHWLDRARAVKRMGYDVHILTTVTSEKHLEILNSFDFTVHDLKMDRLSVNIIAEVVAIYRMYKFFTKINPDLVNLITIKPVIYGGIILRLLRKKTISSLAGLGFISRPSGRFFSLVSLVRYLLRLSIFGSAVLENESDKKYINKIKPKVEAITINGAGVDLSKFSYTECPKGKRIKILFASRLLWAKGLGRLVKACDKLKEDGALIDLHVAGLPDHGSKDEIPNEKIRQWESRGSIIWHGHVEAMPELISQVDVVCLPTTYGEGVPRILIEAAACGRPIVATDTPGCNDIVQHDITGYLYSPFQEGGLYSCLNQMIQSRESFDKFGRAARRHVEHKFSNEVVIEKWSKLYKKLLHS